MGMYGICHWKDCKEEAVCETKLDYPRIFLCSKHYGRFQELTRINRSFGTIQRIRHLKGSLIEQEKRQ